MEDYQVAFWVSGSMPSDNNPAVGCSVHGFCDVISCEGPFGNGNKFWHHGIKGQVISGNYKKVLEEVKNISLRPKACVVFFKKAFGSDDFVAHIGKNFPNVPVIGGGAAHIHGKDEGELLPVTSEVTVLLIAEGEFEHTVLNIYDDLNVKLEINPGSERVINKVRVMPDGDWQDAIAFYNNYRNKLKIGDSDFESLCLCDEKRRNLHCSISNGQLYLGANYPPDRIVNLKYADRETATKRVKSFFNDEDSLIFGCAGARLLLDEPFFTGARSLAGFLFGEIVSDGKQAGLGNLMFAKLKKIK